MCSAIRCKKCFFPYMHSILLQFSAVRTIYTFTLFHSEMIHPSIQVSTPVMGVDVDVTAITFLEVHGSSVYSNNAFNSFIQEGGKENWPQFLTYKGSAKYHFTYNRCLKKSSQLHIHEARHLPAFSFFFLNQDKKKVTCQILS